MGVGFNTPARQAASKEYTQSVIENALKKTFAPEFLNRVDDVVIFDSLLKDHIFKIIDIELKKLFKRIGDLGYDIKLTDAAKEFIAEKGWDPSFGARPLKRAIQKYLEDPLAEEIIRSKISEGDIIRVDYKKDEEEININIVKSKTKKEKSDDNPDKKTKKSARD